MTEVRQWNQRVLLSSVDDNFLLTHEDVNRWLIIPMMSISATFQLYLEDQTRSVSVYTCRLVRHVYLGIAADAVKALGMAKNVNYNLQMQIIIYINYAKQDKYSVPPT